MRKIDFRNGNTPGISEQILETMQNNAEESIEVINVARAYQTDAQIVNDNETIRMGASEIIGNSLTFENYGIRIGKGISHIKVYAQVFFEYIATDQNYFWIQVRKNDEIVASKLNTCPPNEDYIIADIYNEPISVNEGDLITLNGGDCNNKLPTTRSGKFNTFLIVEALKTHIE